MPKVLKNMMSDMFYIFKSVFACAKRKFQSLGPATEKYLLQQQRSCSYCSNREVPPITATEKSHLLPRQRSRTYRSNREVSPIESHPHPIRLRKSEIRIDCSEVFMCSIYVSDRLSTRLSTQTKQCHVSCKCMSCKPVSCKTLWNSLHIGMLSRS